MPQRRLALTLLLATATLLASCGGSSDGSRAGEGGDGARLHVVTAFYPLEYATQQVVSGVDGVTVETLTGPGVDAHDLELTPRQVGSISEADLVIFSAGMQPAVDEAVSAQAADHSLDTTTVADLVERLPGGHDDHDRGGADGEDEHHDHAEDGAEDEEHDPAHGDEAHEGHDHGPLDPHFWLDPERYAAVGEAIAEELATVDPDNADAYRSNAEDFSADLMALDEEFATALASCEQDTLVTTHEAFGYLADRYGFHQVGMTGISPEAEASPARMAEITREVKELNVSALYAQSSLGGDLAEVIAAETGTQILVLDPIEGITGDSPGQDYGAVMRANLDSLRQGQECS